MQRKTRFLILAAILAATFFLIDGRSHAQDLSGVWKGRWTADATERRPEHGGSLRVRLIKAGGNTYQGRFAGRFALIIPYFYRATVYQYGDRLYSSKRIGRRGNYEMSLQHGAGNLQGRWNVGNQAGSIRLRRR
jgi:hypothetical protein